MSTQVSLGSRIKGGIVCTTFDKEPQGTVPVNVKATSLPTSYDGLVCTVLEEGKQK